MSQAKDGTGDTREGGLFPHTQWTVVLAAAQAGTPKADEALAKLCEVYWFPLYAYARRKGKSPEDAQDVTQSFFLRLIEKNSIAAAERERGRFRSFLLTRMQYFMINEWRHGQAQKREGSHQVLSLDAEVAETRFGAEPVDNSSAENLYDRTWAWTVLDRVLGRLRREFEEDHKGAVFERLKVTLKGEKLEPSTEAVAAELAMSAEALRMAVHRLRARFRKLLREEIAPMVASPDEIDYEIRHLFASLGG